MKLLPAHLTKLRWLLSQREKMSRPDSTYITDIAKDISDTQAKEAHPITLMMIDSLYDSYKAKAKEGNHV